ncbi:hypothetical protein GGQ86_003028 [Xanthobacter flavus]|uniref:Helix-turn-helix domain-containing protein n=1 Tax=Xanthobacter flavus TaxID=281 RepID=A0A9W6CNS9_XANFL|nr:helix-turn-helix domain-containing protein [Xanthobacter flavus]MDR6334546.1 hypothetical protein [Xanthobacter flavus]GLI23436.1 hypothetical protein XFLAVUS301_31100 [Xanthobacter flavus]
MIESKSPYLTISDASKYLRLAPITLAKMRTYGGGPAFIRLSAKHIVYRIDDLEHWASARRFKHTSEYARESAA